MSVGGACANSSIPEETGASFTSHCEQSDVGTGEPNLCPKQEQCAACFCQHDRAWTDLGFIGFEVKFLELCLDQ